MTRPLPPSHVLAEPWFRALVALKLETRAYRPYLYGLCANPRSLQEAVADALEARAVFLNASHRPSP